VRLVELRCESTRELLLSLGEMAYDPGVPGLVIATPGTDGALLNRADVEQLHRALGEWLERNRA
jgi:hypothetical protein